MRADSRPIRLFRSTCRPRAWRSVRGPRCRAAVAILSLLVLVGAAPAHATSTGIAVHVGGGGAHSRVYELAVTRGWDWQHDLVGGWVVTGYWEGDLGYWRRATPLPGKGRDVEEVGITPLVRARTDVGGTRVYFDIGVGAHLLHGVSNYHDRLSTAFEFSPELGFGVALSHGWEVGYRLRHVSNAGIKEPNGGVNFNLLTVRREF